MGKLVKAYWDCKWCQTTGIGGDLRDCPNCSRPRGDVKFYMKDNMQDHVVRQGQTSGIEYVDEAKAQTINRNADWYCPYCDSLNNASDTVCKGCGATVDDSEKNYFDIKREAEQKQAAQQAAAEPKMVYKLDKVKLFKRLLILAAIIGVLVFIFWPRTKEAQIKELDWERTINVEKYTNVEESDWNLPQGANLHSKREEIHHYDQVLDHYETQRVQRSREVYDHDDVSYTYNDLGNGYMEEIEHRTPVYRTEYYDDYEDVPIYVSVPRYQTKYYYDIWKWLPHRDVSDRGVGHTENWPECALAEDEREGQRKEKYSMTVTIKDKESSYGVPYSTWTTLESGDEVLIKGGSKLVDKDGNTICELD
ncbi:MAG: hypothetical protein MJ131_04480 [Lachnospiraceae bacterium]|nr:hypothetical protein [Lachnospiraceae bacterium]